MDKLSIGKMAKLHGISEKTLRLYHEYGLIVPHIIDRRTGYRYYTLEQSSRLDMITFLKSIGLSLQEIKQIMEKQDVDYLLNLINKQIELLSNKIYKLQLSKKEAQRISESIKLYKSKPVCNEVILERIKKRAIIKFDIIKFPIDDINNSADETLLTWDLCLRHVKQEFLKSNLNLTLFHNIGCIISKDDLRNNNLLINKAFVFIDNDYINTPVDIIPENDYLCIYCDGMISENGIYREAECLKQLLDYINKNDYEIVGDYIGEVLFETPAFLYDGRDMMIKLQIPIVKK